MKQIDRPGTFIGTIEESALGETAKGFPQWVARIAATKFYANTKELLTHYGLEQPAFVDYTDEGILAYMVLFNDNGPLKNYEQIQAATGWDGQDFQTLSDLVGKTVLFRVEEETYNNKVQLKVNWIDAADAPPERTLKSVDADKAKALTNKFLAGIRKPVAPAKPAVAALPKAPAAPPVATPATVPPTTVSSPVSPSTTPTVTTPVAEQPKTPSRRRLPAAPAPAAPVASAPPSAAPPAAAPASSCTKMQAWEYVNQPSVKADNEDQVVEEAWIAATSEIGADKEEKDFTPEMWARVRDTVVKDLT